MLCERCGVGLVGAGRAYKCAPKAGGCASLSRHYRRHVGTRPTSAVNWGESQFHGMRCRVEHAVEVRLVCAAPRSGYAIGCADCAPPVAFFSLGFSSDRGCRGRTPGGRTSSVPGHRAGARALTGWKRKHGPHSLSSTKALQMYVRCPLTLPTDAGVRSHGLQPTSDLWLLATGVGSAL